MICKNPATFAIAGFMYKQRARLIMKIRVSFIVFGNFAGKHIFEVNELLNKDQLHEMLFQELSKETWDWPLTKEDVEIIKIIPMEN